MPELVLPAGSPDQRNLRWIVLSIEAKERCATRVQLNNQPVRSEIAAVSDDEGPLIGRRARERRG
jgi:hypothetical protein